ncbi:MAG: SsrA-binding protein SmpB [Planctomycetales bacterium]|nr:SsrA-binding protein SmpB [bacterium]UNM07871.1 MAG: SsrA-binding protein SmpB [Planctomycetales bacterium]
MSKPWDTPVISNRKAYHDYEIVVEMEAGIVLEGSEAKSIRMGGFTLRDSYCDFRDGELYLLGSNIPAYEKNSTHRTYVAVRPRKLLLHRQELRKLQRAKVEKGLTIIPLKAYFVNGRVKIMIGMARGKRQYDKRASIKDRDIKRELERSGRHRS